MSTGQGTTWVVVADAHQARVLEVADAGLLPRLLMTVQPPAPEGQQRSPEHLWRHGDDPRALHEEQRSVHALVQVLERGLADNQLRHLVLVAPPRMLGVLRESLPRGLSDRLRSSLAKDWGHVSDAELPQQTRPLVEIWPR
jgi:protein required for attachment to host cells